MNWDTLCTQPIELFVWTRVSVQGNLHIEQVKQGVDNQNHTSRLANLAISCCKPSMSFVDLMMSSCKQCSCKSWLSSQAIVVTWVQYVGWLKIVESSDYQYWVRGKTCLKSSKLLGKAFFQGCKLVTHCSTHGNATSMCHTDNGPFDICKSIDKLACATPVTWSWLYRVSFKSFASAPEFHEGECLLLQGLLEDAG